MAKRLIPFNLTMRLFVNHREKGDSHREGLSINSLLMRLDKTRHGELVEDLNALLMVRQAIHDIFIKWHEKCSRSRP